MFLTWDQSELRDCNHGDRPRLPGSRAVRSGSALGDILVGLLLFESTLNAGGSGFLFLFILPHFCVERNKIFPLCLGKLPDAVNFWLGDQNAVTSSKLLCVDVC